MHQGWSERTPILVFPREIPVTGEGPVVAMTTEIEERMKQHFRSKPVHITWAMKDVAFLPTYLDTLWLDTFPDASVTKLDDAGHYLQEDAHERIVPELVEFVSALPPPAPVGQKPQADVRRTRARPVSRCVLERHVSCSLSSRSRRRASMRYACGCARASSMPSK